MMYGYLYSGRLLTVIISPLLIIVLDIVVFDIFDEDNDKCDYHNGSEDDGDDNYGSDDYDYNVYSNDDDDDNQRKI